MSSLSRDTVKRLTILYLVGQFTDGVFGNYRFQKFLYFAEKESIMRPFEFSHTQYGQYSLDARTCLDQLKSMGHIEVLPLPDANKTQGKLVLTARSDFNKYRTAVQAISHSLRQAIDDIIEKYQYIPNTKLKSVAHADAAFRETVHGQVILSENLPTAIETTLPDDDCEELELALNPRFVAAMHKIADGLSSVDFDIDQVRKVDSFL